MGAGEYAQCETQAVFKGHTFTFHEGTNGCPYLVPHVGQHHFYLLEEIGQLPVVLQLVIVHQLMHLLPCSISFGTEAAHHGLMLCLHDVIPQNSPVSGFPSGMPQGNISCTIPWTELRCMASSPDSIWKSSASLMPSS